MLLRPCSAQVSGEAVKPPGLILAVLGASRATPGEARGTKPGIKAKWPHARHVS